MKNQDIDIEVVKPAHYTTLGATCRCGLPIECIQITERMNFNLGNVIKYVWRAGKKDPTKHIQDLEKAKFYIDREIALIAAKTNKEGTKE